MSGRKTAVFRFLGSIGLAMFVGLGLLGAWWAVINNHMQPVTAGLAIIGLLVAIALLARLQQLAGRVESLRAIVGNLEIFERDINSKVDEIANGTRAGAQLNITALSRRGEALARQVGDLEKRLVAQEKLSEAAPRNLGPAPEPEEAPVRIRSEAASKSPAALSRINLKDALDSDGLSLHLQPIVSLPDRKPLHYEAFMRLRLRDGTYLDASQFIKVAEKGNLMPAIDKKVLFSSIRMLRTLETLKRKAGLFCNMSSDLLADTGNFREIFQFLEANAALSESLVFEISQRHWRNLEQRDRDRLSAIADLGYALSLDQVLDLRIAVAELQKSGFRYIKTPAGILLHGTVDDDRFVQPPELAPSLENDGLRLIATEVEKEEEVVALLDFGVRHAQGSIFAPPRPVKAELLKPQRPVPESDAA